MKLYVAIENDKYELIAAVADTRTELAQMTGKQVSVISKNIRKSKDPNYKPFGRYKYEEVEVDGSGI